ncbi:MULTISPECIES: hypothetical protein [Pseudomonas]|uniref:Uncharacterized protein n=1 Tax=Pseudomonas lutea TaxID=243924 RepID=A0A9X8QLH7_9PSED|nr:MULTISPECIES: hypothetical protein [Pseudomonas]SER29061.1 hypothetical protein SAMN05216409_11624 [Pseudomonas lutea]
MIFDAVTRTDASPKLSIETDFEFLNRSARSEMARAREFLENLVSNYPDPDDLISRFRSNNNSNFRSAEFELLLYSALHRQGFLLTPHPELPNGSSSRPDFLVTTPVGDSFYLEAVLASENSADQTNQPLIATTLDVFTTASHANFGVIVKTSGYPSTQPRRRRILRKTLAWLNSLDPDEVQAEIDASGHDAMPTLVLNHESLEISVQALPLRADRRGKASRLLAAQFGQAGWVNSWSPIKDAITFKGNKYGSLDKPLVVAVNFSGHHLDRLDEMQALFGQEQIILSTENLDAEPRLDRAPNGAWVGKSGPQFRRVSGAWLFDNLCVYNVPSRHATLYLNP